METFLQTSLCPTLRIHTRSNPSPNPKPLLLVSSSITTTASKPSIPISMLKRWLLSSYSSFALLHKATDKNNTFLGCIDKKPKGILSTSSRYKSCSKSKFSWPFATIAHRRLIHCHRILAMAEQSSKTTSQQSHKHTNRLAAEHSPYLLQHAHNPVCYTVNCICQLIFFENYKLSGQIGVETLNC